MATIEIGKDNFKDIVSKEGIVILHWWADGCGPCHSFAPIFEQASEQYPNIRFGTIATEKERELTDAFAVRSLPTVMALRDGFMLFERVGAPSAAELEELIRQVLALDMNEVRQRVVELRAQQ
ncbi:thioredoxin family protein [Archangium lansingense]|uniref:thioredoxin family protein n=1 Tax=Archangium lansingense TaxID=2995310 RepID=UPI003B811557